MHHRDSSSHPLDYLQPSPVRGQLEPHDDVTTKPGWRFLQCTDTPNQLKVLLPPRTAQIYASLLKAELNELAKHRDASWQYILEIRHLKDRMIRKCQRLARAYSANDSATRVSFLTLHAPPDFRLKEMEKWIRRQEALDPLGRKKLATVKPRGSFCCDRCASTTPHYHTLPSRRSSMHSIHSHRSSLPKATHHSKRSSVSRVTPTNSEPGSPLVAGSNETIAHGSKAQLHSDEQRGIPEFSHVHESTSSRNATVAQERTRARISKHQRSMSIDESRFVAGTRETKRAIHMIPEDPHELSTDQSNHSIVRAHHEVESLAHLSISSPDPIPVPYHGSTSATFAEICDSPVDITRDGTNVRRAPGASEDESSPSPDDEPSTDDMAPGTLRKRSSLKRNNSDLRMSMAHSTKTVSWAMDRDWAQQMSKYHAATELVEHADQDWGLMCEKYKEELAGLKALRRNVTQTLSKLRQEAEKLQREDEVIRDQEEKLRMGYEQLEQKHGQYRSKINAVLHETEQVLLLCGTKRDDGLHRS
ncbi:hypothetical protein F5I97DRAFT_1929816 [Phlebopus sp. FC_14]|nr:hypothetical protein F5I97DRAFT_1929816 [Phlebopus sp. FC_14]